MKIMLNPHLIKAVPGPTDRATGQDTYWAEVFNQLLKAGNDVEVFPVRETYRDNWRAETIHDSRIQ
jgi:hypothetical protein